MPIITVLAKQMDVDVPILGRAVPRLALAVFLLITGNTLAQTASEQDVKAAFLLNFVNYVEWPPEIVAMAGPASLCIVGQDPFGDTLDTLAAVRAHPANPLDLEHIDSALGAQGCRIVYINRDSASAVRRDLAQLKDLPILTVGDGDDFAEAGGIIAFRLDQNRVKLTINVSAAERAGLKVSSRLLRLARIVE